jgi:hypothetical protein
MAGRLGWVAAVHRRRVIVIATVAGLLLVVAWLGTTALLARASLTQARDDVLTVRSRLQTADLAGARQQAQDLRGRVGRAHWLTRGPVWRGMAAVPVVGEPFRSVRGLTGALQILGQQAVPALLTASDHIDPTSLRDAQGRIAVDRVAAAAPALASASAAVDEAVARVSALPGHTWLSSVDEARALLLRELAPAAGDVRDSQEARDVIRVHVGVNKS